MALASSFLVGFRLERFPTPRDVVALLAPAAHEPQRRQQQRRNAETDQQERRQQPADRLRDERRFGRDGRRWDGSGRRHGSGSLLGLGGRLRLVGEELFFHLDAGIGGDGLFGSRFGCDLGLVSGLLQGLQLGISKLEEPAAFLDTGCDAGVRCGRGRRRRILRTRGGRDRRRSRSRRACNLAVGRQEAELAALCGAVLPLVGMPADLGVGDSRGQRAEIGGLGETQGGARAQDIDVAAERLGIRLVDRDHHLIDRDVFGTQSVGDRPQRLGSLNGPIGAAGSGRRARRRGRLGPRYVRRRLADGRRIRYRSRRGGSRRRSRGASDLTAGRVAGGRTGLGRPNRGRSGGRRNKDRRVEQNRIFLDVSAARPRGLDQQSHERLGDRFARGDLHDVAAIGGGHDSKLETTQKRRTVETAAREHVVAGERRPAIPASRRWSRTTRFPRGTADSARTAARSRRAPAPTPRRERPVAA